MIKIIHHWISVLLFQSKKCLEVTSQFHRTNGVIKSFDLSSLASWISRGRTIQSYSNIIISGFKSKWVIREVSIIVNSQATSAFDVYTFDGISINCIFLFEKRKNYVDEIISFLAKTILLTLGLLSKFQALSSLFWRAKGVSQSSTLHSESSKTIAPWFGNCAAIFWQVAGNGGPLFTLFGSLALALELRKLFEPKYYQILWRKLNISQITYTYNYI